MCICLTLRGCLPLRGCLREALHYTHSSPVEYDGALFFVSAAQLVVQTETNKMPMHAYG